MWFGRRGVSRSVAQPPAVLSGVAPPVSWRHCSAPLCKCLYVCLYVCLRVCLYVCLCVCLSLCVLCAYAYIYIRMYVRMCINVCLYICMSRCMHVDLASEHSTSPLLCTPAPQHVCHAYVRVCQAYVRVCLACAYGGRHGPHQQPYCLHTDPCEGIGCMRLGGRLYAYACYTHRHAWRD